MRLHLLTYANERFREAQKSLCTSAKKCGFDNVISMSPDDIYVTSFWTENSEILSAQRGAGYWLWKPWIIREQLEKIPKGDVVIYCDCGRTGYYYFHKKPDILPKLALKSRWGMVIGPSLPHLGPISRWVKQDCFIAMGVHGSEFVSRPMLQATWSVWTPNELAFRFLDQWLEYCCDPRCLTDQPNAAGVANYPDFIDHRHDQSVLTLLAYRERAPFLDLSDTGIFRILSHRPKSKVAQMLLKAPRNAERLLAGTSPMYLVLREHILLKLRY